MLGEVYVCKRAVSTQRESPKGNCGVDHSASVMRRVRMGLRLPCYTWSIMLVDRRTMSEHRVT